jgi:hypothetical protein
MLQLAPGPKYNPMSIPDKEDSSDDMVCLVPPSGNSYPGAKTMLLYISAFLLRLNTSAAPPARYKWLLNFQSSPRSNPNPRFFRLISFDVKYGTFRPEAASVTKCLVLSGLKKVALLERMVSLALKLKAEKKSFDSVTPKSPLVPRSPLKSFSP